MMNASDTPHVLPSRRKRLSPEERKRQLLQIGIKVFVELGLEGAGHANIAKVANVSTATVFNYFPTRQILTQSLISEIKLAMTRGFEDMLTGWDYENSSPKARLYHIAESYDQLLIEQPNVFKAFLMWGVSFNADLRREYLEFQDETLSRFEGVMGSVLRNKGHARVLFGAANTLAMMRFDNYPAEELTAYVVALTRGLDNSDAK